jgi:hypothetical protein
MYGGGKARVAERVLEEKQEAREARIAEEALSGFLRWQ